MYKIKQMSGFFCEICGKAFLDKKSLDDHQLTHDVELVNRMSASHLVNNMSAPHLVNNMSIPQQSSACISQNSVTPSIAVTSPIHTSMHVNHTQEVKPIKKLKAHACDECGKSYTRKDHLTRHKLEHTGVRPHICCVCMKAFIRKDKLQRHERIHMKDRDVKFCCSVCGKTFLRKDGLSKHSKTHSLKFNDSVELNSNNTIKTEPNINNSVPVVQNQ